MVMAQANKQIKIVQADAVAGQDFEPTAFFDKDGNPVDVGGGDAAPVAWGDVTGKPSTFPPATHTHVVADVTGLKAGLDGKAASSHTHTVAEVPGLQAIIDDLTGRLEALEAE